MSSEVWKVQAILGLVVVLAFSLLLIGLGFGSNPHAIVDFGRELYVAWRLQAGDILGVDLAYFNGPLSPHWNSLWFRWLGPGFSTLLAINGALSLLLMALLFHLCLRTADAFSATLACLLAAGGFAFVQIDGIGNDTYLVPYSHEILHGLLLLLLGAWGLTAVRLGTALRATSAGLALGMLFLTKPEIFLAALAAYAAGVAVLAWRSRESRARAIGGFLGAAIALPLCAFGLLFWSDPDAAPGALLGAWRYIGNPQLTGLPFYQATLGSDALGANFGLAISIALVWILALAALLGVAKLGEQLSATRGHPEEPRAVAIGVGLTALAIVCFAAPVLAGVTWIDSLRPLPLLLLGVLVSTLVAVARAPNDERALLRLVLSVAGLALLAKIALRVQLLQYGFALAMPGCVVVVLAVTHWLPEAMAQRLPAARRVLRAGALGFGGAALTALLLLSLQHRETRSTELGTGRDAFLAGREGPAIAAILAQLEERIATGETLAVVPEGVMINYLLRIQNPTGHLNLMPPEIVMFGEESIIESYEEHPPDWILWLPRDTAEYGFAAFGTGYGEEVAALLEANYERDPLPGLARGARLLRRAASPANQSKKRK